MRFSLILVVEHLALNPIIMNRRNFWKMSFSTALESN